jgi:azurin
MAASHESQHEVHHPSTKQYILIAIILFAITIVEFIIIMDMPGPRGKVISDALGQPSTTILLFLLSSIKFAVVILFYMHLKFDNPLFFRVFMAGLILAFMVGLALIGLFTAILGGPRELATVEAVPFEHHVEDEHAAGTPISGPAGPLTMSVNGDALEFDIASYDVTAGQEVTLTFENVSTANQHNWVLVEAGAKDAVATDGATAGPVNGWIPPGDPRVLASTGLLDAGASEVLVFTAPTAGTYQFVCTFPGHNATMFGDFIVH